MDLSDLYAFLPTYTVHIQLVNENVIKCPEYRAALIKFLASQKYEVPDTFYRKATSWTFQQQLQLEIKMRWDSQMWHPLQHM